MHNQIIQQINSLALSASRSNNPRIFLEGIAGTNGLHYRWHFRGLRQSLGFLLFHWHLCEAIRFIRLQVTPLNQSHFSVGGLYYSPDVDW